MERTMDERCSADIDMPWSLSVVWTKIEIGHIGAIKDGNIVPGIVRGRQTAEEIHSFYLHLVLLNLREASPANCFK